MSTEYFYFLAGSWNVTCAKKIYDKICNDSPDLKEDRLRNVSIEQLSRYLMGAIQVDEKYAMELTNDDPIFIVKFKNVETGKWDLTFTIDGWHRIYRDWKNGKEWIVGFEFSIEESKEIACFGD